MHLHRRYIIALMLSTIVAVSVAQTTATMSSFVYADNKLLIQLLRSPTGAEPVSATGTVAIDPESGTVTVELRQASPDSSYLAIFAASGNNIQLGNITTDDKGRGSLETTLAAWRYVGVFQILRIGLLRFVSAYTVFTVAAATGRQTLSTNSTTSSVNQVQLVVEPPLRTINAGEFAKFNIQIIVNGTAKVVLTTAGIPPYGMGIFTRDVGVANPEFHSELVILTSQDTPVGNYSITVIALANGEESNTQVNLGITAYSSMTSSHTITSTASSYALGVSLTTDQLQYQPDVTVHIQGYVTDGHGGAIREASVAVQVDNPTGTEVMFMNNLKTDMAGVFRLGFTLPLNATAGTYTTFASASKPGYASATTHGTFAVGISTTPSVVIQEVYTTDLSGNSSAIFSPGQTVLVWVVVENGGATFDGVIWVQIRDANGTPIWIQFHISSLDRGQSVVVAFGFQVTAGVTPGIYTANILVSDKLISQGGSFFASANTEFAVAS